MSEPDPAVAHKPGLGELVGRLREQMPTVRERYRVSHLGVFGSYVRGEEKATSDLDLLVEFDEPPSLLKYIELENYLSDVLGVRVDLVMKSSLKPRIGRHILREVVAV